MKFLSNQNIKSLTKVINDDYPNLKIKSTKFINGGMDFLVLQVNNNLIFRFPKVYRHPLSDYSNNIRRMKIEMTILQELQGNVTLPIPKVSYVGKKYAYFGYKKIPGTSLTNRILATLTQKQRTQLISNLANFLYEFHSTITLRHAKKIGIVHENYLSYSRLIEKKIVKPKKIKNKVIADFITETVKEYNQMIKKKEKEVVLYNDLHGDNMAFGSKTKKLNGIFDFGDVAIGDIHIDFNCLYRFSNDFFEDLIQEYQKLSGYTKLYKRRIVLYARINELCDLAECIDESNSPLYKHVMREIKGWIKEKDIYK